MKPKVIDEIDDRTRGEIQAAYQLFYRQCVLHHSINSDQWAGLITLVRHFSQQGICRTKSEPTGHLNNSAKDAASNLLKAIGANNLSDSVLWAIRFGHLFRYGFSIVDDRDIQVGRRVISGGRRAAAAIHGDPAERIERNKHIQNFVAKAMSDDPALPYEKAMRKAASKFELSPETVKKVTTNPRPRRRMK